MNGIYPLVVCDTAMKVAIYNGFVGWKWWFSMVMLVYWRVILEEMANMEHCTNMERLFAMIIMILDEMSKNGK